MGVNGQSIQGILSERRRAIDGPLVIGIGGGSGSGKSTIAELIGLGLRPLATQVITQDRFFKPPEQMPTYYSSLHRDQRPDFNHPDSTDSAAMVAFCRDAAGADVIILEGILVLHYPDARSLMHLLCYVDTELDLMLARRTERNLRAGYGGGAGEIAHYNADCVTPQHRRFNAPTADHADVLIPNDDERIEDRDRVIAEICDAIAAVL